MLLCVGCKTTQTQVQVPTLDFPLFPVPPVGAVLFDEESGRVDMSLDFFERIYEYKVRVEETQAVYENIYSIQQRHTNRIRDETSRGK